ncbi:MAG TPA: hypothetical protein VHX36_14385 [Candidatus Acidoferrales bacterium]|nr:hypothetical protein [Candidatus Acidoferrales bacterium]
MESHLTEGCKECSKTLNLWQRVYEVGRREAAYAPPASAVAMAKGTFSIHGPRKAGRASRAIASLLFDSANTPLAMGVRSSAGTGRQLLYGVSNYRVDVRIEPQHDSDRIALVGQVLNSRVPEQSVGAVPVRLCRGRKVLVESTTTPFGEFDLECELAKGLELKVTLPKEELCLPLVEATVKPAHGGREGIDSKKVRERLGRDSRRTRKKV